MRQEVYARGDGCAPAAVCVSRLGRASFAMCGVRVVLLGHEVGSPADG